MGTMIASATALNIQRIESDLADRGGCYLNIPSTRRRAKVIEFPSKWALAPSQFRTFALVLAVIVLTARPYAAVD
jgi:hypothetical protein